MKIFFLLYFAIFHLSQIVTSISLQKVVDGFTQPVAYIEDPLGGNRKFVVEKGGLVLIVKNGNKVNGTPFLDLSNVVSKNANEGGLLGLAFDPKFKTNRYFYVYYTVEVSGGIKSILRRLRVSKTNPDVAQVGKADKEIFWSLKQEFTNHNGGQILFGPDKQLYVFLGDGGSGGDPNNNAQNLKSQFGKILRIQPKTKGRKAKYKIPDSNPFKYNMNGYPKEIFHYGVRNPWRNSFDSVTGDLYIADVGQNAIEEVSIAAKGEKGLNFGWRLLEGDQCYDPSSGCRNGAGKLEDPILTYNHDSGDCSITGGYVYRGSVHNDLNGKYLYGDFCSGKIRVGTKNGSGQWNSNELIDTTFNIASFGEDKEGELYVVDYGGGGIYKVTK